MNSKRLVLLGFLCFLMAFSVLTWNIREAEATTITVTRTFSSLSYDGHIHKISYINYIDARNATEGTAIVNWSTGNTLGQMKGSDFWIVYRVFVFFDTNLIPNGANITSAKLSLYVVSDFSTTDFNVTVQNGQPTYPRIPLVKEDYYHLYYSGDGGSRNTSEISAGYWNITVSTEGLAWINKEDTTKLCLRSSRDVNSNEPTGNEYVIFYTTEMGEAYSPKLYVTYECEGYCYIVHGPYYENGAVANCIANVTLYSKTDNPYPFILNGTDGEPDTEIVNASDAGWYFQWNATTSINKTRSYYLSSVTFDELWIYVADPAKTYLTYTIKFMDLAGALNSMPYVKIQRYINGMKTVEKAKVDVEKKLSTFLEEGAAYTLLIEDTTSSYTYGDLLFTSETSITLTLKGIEFPQDIILAYQYNRIYAYRHDNQTSISVVYQDVEERASNVSINILFENGSSVSGTYPYWQNNTYYFNHTYSSAIYNTTYIVRVTIYHPAYGTLYYHAIFARAWTTQPWNLPIGNIPGFNMANLIPLIIIFACFLIFSQINVPTGCFIGTAMAIILTWRGWISIPSPLLVAAVVFDILIGMAHARRHG